MEQADIIARLTRKWKNNARSRTWYAQNDKSPCLSLANTALRRL